MQTALRGQPERPVTQPQGVVSVRIDPLTGKRAAPSDPVATFEYFMQPYVPDEDKNPTTVDAAPAAPTSPVASAPAEESQVEESSDGVY